MRLRIISGILKGRFIDVPRKFSAQPMGERVRSALFNSLTGELEGTSVLDAFGGSGACGLEAFSRGADNVLILEKDRSVYRYLNKNFKKLNLIEDSRIHASKAPAQNYLKANPKLQFNVIICDPPYDLAEKAAIPLSGLQDSDLVKTLNLISSKLKKDGTLILSWPEKVELPELAGLSLVKSKNYAGAKLAWYS
jgi:16S rRNA (guanine966-N2)-methyltransferase